ncbi:MAG: glycosyltransferase [Caldilineaceae bacterium]
MCPNSWLRSTSSRSRRCGKGCRRVLPQAMATGLPIVTTAADGSAEAVEDGVNGLVVPAGDPGIGVRTPAPARRPGAGPADGNGRPRRRRRVQRHAHG